MALSVGATALFTPIAGRVTASTSKCGDAKFGSCQQRLLGGKALEISASSLTTSPAGKHIVVTATSDKLAKVERQLWFEKFLGGSGDPFFYFLGLGKDEKAMKELKLKEAKNGRLAVRAIVGHFIQAVERAVKNNQWSDLSKSGVARNAGVVAMNVLLAMPALAGEKGKIFDFNLTLPIIAIEFLALMVALDNIWFKPVAAVMDQRDEAIREKLLGVRDNSGEIQKLQDEAESVIKAARAETTAALNQTKKETAAALEISLKESKARIEKELAASLSNLEEQKEETLRGLDTQVQALSDAILGKVIPFSVK